MPVCDVSSGFHPEMFSRISRIFGGGGGLEAIMVQKLIVSCMHTVQFCQKAYPQPLPSTRFYKRNPSHPF